MNTFSPCAVIPVYNHGETTADVVRELKRFNLPVIIVDDGSDEHTGALLEKIPSDFPGTELMRRVRNGGKGAAMIDGFLRARERGYSHVFQIDADGQHNTERTTEFLNAAELKPEAVIAGMPRYDATVPESRKEGRKITNWWVSVETLSMDIKDAMCGFRVYPLEQVYRLITRKNLWKRMPFDIDILVRLHWRNVEMVFLPVEVTYPKDGISHFRMFEDNVQISLAHTILFFGMLLRLPVLLARMIKRTAGKPGE